MNRKIFTAITFLALILINSLFFLLEHGLTATFWITFTFVWVAFISSYSFQMLFWHKLQTPEKGFLLLSSFTVTIIYELIQFPVCILFTLQSNSIPSKITILVNIIILIVSWILTLGGLLGSDYIQKINARKSNHRTEL